MTDTWRGWFVDHSGDGPATVVLRDDLDASMLGDGDVTIAVTHSSLNYKDALALTGRPGILRRPALIPGVDLVGEVLESAHPDWAPGDLVLANGTGGLSEVRHGGLTQRLRVDGGGLVRVPETLGPLRAAAIGTAGFTAQLCILELERQGAVDADVLVTGAAGGVGSIAVALLASRGRRVVASTGRASEHARLRELGAAEILDRAELEGEGRPLQSQRWGGVVDTVGGGILANAIAQTAVGGTVAACGNAGSDRLEVSVYPFILRGVRLSGVNCVEIPHALRQEAWDRLAADLDPAVLDGMLSEVALEDVLPVAEALIAGRAAPRTVVHVSAPAG